MKKKYLFFVFIFLLIVFLATVVCLVVKNNNKGSENMQNIVILETTKGIIEIELDFENAPISSNNFKNYVTSGFYDGLIFHRVIPGFMVQGGGFNTDATQKQPSAPIILESNNGLKNNVGTIAMARTNAPNSATSQFFINVTDNDLLNYVSESYPGYAVFGKVTKGMHIVFEIEKVKTHSKNSHENWPIEDVIITKAYMK